MARSKREPRTRAALLGAVSAIAGAMERPLYRAHGFADALTFVGYGLASVQDDGARSVQALATELLEDLDDLRASWDALYDVLDGRRARTGDDREV